MRIEPGRIGEVVYRRLVLRNSKEDPSMEPRQLRLPGFTRLWGTAISAPRCAVTGSGRWSVTEALPAVPSAVIAEHFPALDAPLKIVRRSDEPALWHLGLPPNRPDQGGDARQQRSQAQQVEPSRTIIFATPSAERVPYLFYCRKVVSRWAR